MAKLSYEMMWSDDALQLQSNSIVVRNSSIARDYPGGLSTFLEEFPTENQNEKISVFASMGLSAKEMIECLTAQGFNLNKDFVFVDTELFSFGGSPELYPIDPEVNWIGGYYEDHGIFVRSIETEHAFDQPECGLGSRFGLSKLPTENGKTKLTLH